MNPEELARQNVARSFGVTTITPEQQRAFDAVKSAFQPAQAPVIDISKSQTPFQVSQPQPVQASPFIKGLENTMQTIQSDLQRSQQGIDREEQFFNQILGQLSPDNQMQQFQTLQQQQGIPEMQKQMAELNNIFNQRRVAYENAIIGEEGLGSFAQAPILGRQNRLEVQASRELAPISASIQALNGQYQLAQETVNQMFAIQQNSLNQQLEVRRDFLQRNYDKFDQAQKKQADTELLLLQAKQEENDNLIASQKAGATLAIEAQRRGANPLQVAQFIQRGGTEQEALSVFGNVLAQRTEEENLALQGQQLGLREQQLRNSLLGEQIATERSGRQQIQAREIEVEEAITELEQAGIDYEAIVNQAVQGAGRTLAERERIRQDVLNSSDPIASLAQLGYKSFNEATKSEYDAVFDSTIPKLQNAVALLDTADVKFGNLANYGRRIRKAVNIPNADKEAVAFLLESVNAPIRNKIFGASLTEGEREASNQFLIDTRNDTKEVIKYKASGLMATEHLASERSALRRAGLNQNQIQEMEAKGLIPSYADYQRAYGVPEEFIADPNSPRTSQTPVNNNDPLGLFR